MIYDNEDATGKSRTVICKVHQDAIADFINSLSKQNNVNNIIIRSDEGELFSVRYTIDD